MIVDVSSCYTVGSKAKLQSAQATSTDLPCTADEY